MIKQGQNKSVLDMQSIEEVTWKAKRYDELEPYLDKMSDTIREQVEEISELRRSIAQLQRLVRLYTKA